jgi:starch synthase (maltosyl-transferring)
MGNSGSPSISGRKLRFGRFPITTSSLVVEAGHVPAKPCQGEGIALSATAIREGHDSLGVSAVLYDPQGKEAQRVRLEPLAPAWTVGEGR